MDYPILATKIYIPASRQDLVARPKLIEKLELGSDGKLTLVSAPAGYGKTTLLTQWIKHSQTPFSWLSVDEQDNDLGRFLAYVVASLNSIQILIDVQPFPQFPTQPKVRIDTLLIPLINQLEGVGRRFVLVLDDYHLIQNEEIHQSVAYLLEHLPANMHLVIASRADPPLPLARLRARRQMTEIRVVDLKFSSEEGVSLINQVHEIRLSSDDIGSLVERTGGWIAALQMAMIAMKNRGDASMYLRGFSGSRDYIADFLSVEVIDQQPKYLYDFLLMTSILDRLSGPLCDAITGLEHCQQILKDLRDANIFLESLDDASHWFRYHRLFADLLNQRLLEEHSSEVPALYLRASEWFELQGFLTDAIEYALRGAHFDRAAALIELQAEPVLMRSEIVTFNRWMSRLPDEVIIKHETLCVYYAWAMLISGSEPGVAGTYLDGLKPTGEPTISRLAAVRSILEFFRGDQSKAIQQARFALESLEEHAYFFRHVAAWNLSALLYIRGDQKEGAKMLEEVARVSLASGNFMFAIVACSRLGTTHAQMGELARAEEYFQRAVQIATKDHENPLPAACDAFLGLGQIYWERYQLDLAAKHLDQGIALCKRWREITAINGYIIFAHLKQSLGDPEGADQMFAQAQKLAAASLATDSDDRFVALQRAILFLRRGQIEPARRWAQSKGLERYIDSQNFGSISSLAQKVILLYSLLVYARLLLYQDQLEAAIMILELATPDLEALGYRQQIIESYLLKAIALHEQAENDRSLSCFKQAIQMAETAGYRRIFLDEGAIVEDLIREAVSSGFESSFANELLETLSPTRATTAVPVEAGFLVEPLSEREIEVLRLLGTALTGPEIAERLIISVSTFRTHVKHIYAKLDVHNRFEAVTRADELGLIE